MIDFLLFMFLQIYLIYNGIALYIFIEEYISFNNFNKLRTTSFSEKATIISIMWIKCVFWPKYYDFMHKSVKHNMFNELIRMADERYEKEKNNTETKSKNN